MALEPCPLEFEARLLPKPWGGRGLERWGKVLPPGALVGESWEIYDDAQGSVRCRRGPAEGMGLAELAGLWGGSFYGPGQGPVADRFPVLFKLLDAREDLSLQVHPGDEMARALHGPAARGKSEAWVVLEAGPGARLLNGFKPGTGLREYREALARGAVAGLMNAVPVRPGDVLDVPAGRPHALLGGCLVAEVQQNSDWTYRFWDHGRLVDGRPRELHLEQAEQALEFGPGGWSDGRVVPLPLPAPWGWREVLIANRRFTLERWTWAPGAAAHIEGRWRALMPLDASLTLDWRGRPRGPGPGGRGPWACSPGGTLGLPAGARVRLRAGPQGAQALCIEPEGEA